MARLPIEGVRVTDFTWIGAGSYATKILADFGADVVKIESNRRLDSLRLAQEISEAAVEAGQVVRALVQINSSGETSKSGFDAEALVDAVGEISMLPALQVEGLMTMAPYTDDESVLRKTFAGARHALDEVRRQTNLAGAFLSMGMSNDFEIAIEEGSTLVRLGTVLFGARPKND